MPFVSEYRVFNVLDIEGFTAEMFREDKPEAIPARIGECEAILYGNMHEVTKGEPAYSPLFDKLFMPDLAEFGKPGEILPHLFPRVEPLDGSFLPPQS